MIRILLVSLLLSENILLLQPNSNFPFCFLPNITFCLQVCKYQIKLVFLQSSPVKNSKLIENKSSLVYLTRIIHKIALQQSVQHTSKHSGNNIQSRYNQKPVMLRFLHQIVPDWDLFKTNVIIIYREKNGFNVLLLLPNVLAWCRWKALVFFLFFIGYSI